MLYIIYGILAEFNAKAKIRCYFLHDVDITMKDQLKLKDEIMQACINKSTETYNKLFMM